MCRPIFVSFCLATFSLGEAIPNWNIPKSDMMNAYKQANDALTRNKRSLSTSFDAYSTYIGETNNLTCYVCRPGFYRTGDCQTNLTIGECKQCPYGTYNSRHSIAHRCADCTPHCTDPNAEVVVQCTPKTDIQCHCKEGFYNHSKGPGEWMCMPHSECPPGTEPVQQGSPEVDTNCQKCAEGFFSPTTSSIQKCIKCSACGGDMVEQICTTIKDTVCRPKDTSRGGFLKVGVPIIIVVTFIAALLLLLYFWKCRRRNGTNPFSKIFKMHGLSCCQKRQKRSPNNGGESAQQDNSAQPETLSSGQIGLTIETEMCDYKVDENEWTQIFHKISNYIDKENWKYPIRALFVPYYTPSELDSRVAKIHHDVNFNGNCEKEEIFQCLLSWLKRAGPEASLEVTIEALADENMTGLAHELKKTYGRYHTTV